MALKNFKVPSYTGAGIYALVNRDDMKVYIGQAKNIKRRAESHKTALKNKKHPNLKIQMDCEKDFRFVILQKIPNDYIWLLNLLEKVFMYEVSSSGFYLYNVQGCEDKESIFKNIVFECTNVFRTNEKLKNEFNKALGSPLYLLLREKEDRKLIYNNLENTKNLLKLLKDKDLFDYFRNFYTYNLPKLDDNLYEQMKRMSEWLSFYFEDSHYSKKIADDAEWENKVQNIIDNL